MLLFRGKISRYLLVVGIFLLIFLISCADKGEGEKVIVNATDSFSSTGQVGDYNYSYTQDSFYNRENRFNRVIWQKPKLVIALMGNLKNKTVAEIGAGTGFFTFRILPLAEKTIGIDIDKNMLNYLDSISTHYLPEKIAQKLELRLVEPDDPEIKPGEADIILIVNTFVYLPNKLEYLKMLKEDLKPNGRLYIVDFKMHRIAVGPERSEKIPQYRVEDLLIKAGYTIELSDDTMLPYQYIIIAGA